MAQHLLTIHMVKEGRTTTQFFESREMAEEHGRNMQATFLCDSYVSELKSKTYATRQQESV